MVDQNNYGYKDLRLPFKKVVLTFYDQIDYPYTTTYYVREEATHEQIEELVNCIADLSICVLARYKVDDETVNYPDYKEKVQQLGGGVFGTWKWVLKYKDKRMKAGSKTIPGRNPETSMLQTRGVRPGRKPDLAHPKWQAFLKIFKEICLSNKGIPINKVFFQGDYINGKWPPKGAKKRK